MKRRILNTVLAAIILSFIGLGLIGPGNAKGQQGPPQMPPQAAPQGPPGGQAGGPEPGVARISLIQGDAATQRGDSAQWTAAVVNTPVVNGDNVSTGDQSRAELQLDYADLLRMDQHTQVKVADLANNHLQVQLANGLIDFSILRGTQASVEVDTPNMSVQPSREGEYRIEVASPTECAAAGRRSRPRKGRRRCRAAK
jgi:FecR protein